MLIPDSERISILRARCRDRKPLAWTDKTLVDYDSFRANEGLSPQAIRIARRTRDRLSSFRFALDDLELLVGRPPARPAGLDEALLSQARAYLAGLPYARTPGQTGHCELNRALVFQHGLDGARRILAEKIEHELNPLHPYGCPEAGRDGETPDQMRGETFRSFAEALAGLQALVENAADTVEAALPGASPDRQAELAEMESICARIAHQPPETFREALQLTWFIDFGVAYGDDAGLVSPGHLDRTLAPYYHQDIARGRLTAAEALLLIESYYLLINEFIPDGLAVASMVGGVGPDGQDHTSELSHLCLEALRRTKLVYPTVGVCWHPGTPQALVDHALELIAAGYTTPAFFNDRTIQKGLQKYGLPPSESWNYTNSTCVEITPVGSSNVWVASPYFPVCQFLLEEIAAIADGAPAPADFEVLLQRVFSRLGTAIEQGLQEQNSQRLERARHGGKPLQSLFTNDCLERGLDIDRGGARYNWVECSFVGLANLVDSLQVIRKEIFEGGKLSFGELHAILNADFSGRELERSRFINAYDKYGHDAGEAEALLNTIVGYLESECARHEVYPGNTHFVPGAFCWIMHEELGKHCGATPDGRKAGTPFADGCGPAQGREKYGPTAAILSTTSWDHSPLVGGAAYNMKFNKQLLQGQEGRDSLRNLVITFLKRGGFEVQINVVDKDVLKKARATPELYRDLVVRIGGYTDYFVRLSPGMQDELISRTEYMVIN